MSMPPLDLRTQAVYIWGLGAAEYAQSAQNDVKTLQSYLQDYKDMPSVAPDVAHAAERLETALVALYDAETAVHRITETRMTEEREREQ